MSTPERIASTGRMQENAQDATSQPVWATRLSVALIVAPLIFSALFALLYVDASFGHDGLHCELGWARDDTDNACGGFWR